ncbi:MAG: KTSC domain-containing protein [Verrucomicrobiia bacterium]
MATGAQVVKMTPVDADLFDAIGYEFPKRRLYIKFRTSPALCFDNVPGFRYDGLMAAPRKDAYYRTFIKDRFLTKPVELPPQT